MKILVVSNLQDIFYNELNHYLLNYKDSYDSILLLGEIDTNVLRDINEVITNNLTEKNLFSTKDIYDNSSIDLKYDNLSIKNKIINNNMIIGMENISQINNLKLSDNNKNIIVGDFSFREDIEINSVNSSVLCIYSEGRINTINYFKDMYFIGVSGISIVDTNDYSLLKLY